VVDQQRQQFAKNVPDHQDETQDRDREEDVHDQLATDELVDQLHFVFLLRLIAKQRKVDRPLRGRC